MPFGQKTDAAGREIDFDEVYAELIKPAVEEAGLQPIRADEEAAGGIIHGPMFERLPHVPGPRFCSCRIVTTKHRTHSYFLGRHESFPFFVLRSSMM